MSLIWSRIWGYVVAAAAAIAGLAVLYFKGKQQGKTEATAEAARKEIGNAKTAQEIQQDVAASKPDDVRERLSKYTRD